MATTASFFVVLLFSIVSLVAGGNGDENNNKDTDNNNVKRACADTPYPDMCFSYLSPIKESKDADAHMLAGMAIYSCTSLLNGASNTASTQKYDYQDMPVNEDLCFRNCTEEFEKPQTHSPNHAKLVMVGTTVPRQSSMTSVASSPRPRRSTFSGIVKSVAKRSKRR